ncbi:hypothetical protein MMC21_008018 [Puttea exsequens]|nr:hypothetical protein [Puttea exsequens]
MFWKLSLPSGGSIGAETAVAIILAGGVSWFLAGLIGDVTAAEAALEAPDTDPDHPDDSKCPDPKDKCSDCGGGDGQICTTGPSANCACDTQTCPTGDQEPQCSDPQCKGEDDNKCTVDQKGCACTPKEECLTGLDTPVCDQCGGADQNGKCKGVSKQNELGKPLD